MAWIIITVVVAGLAGLAQLYLPYPPRAFDLFGFKRDWAQAASAFDSVVESGKCHLKHPDVLLGCEDLHYAGGFLYAGCLNSYETRRKWMPGLGFRSLEKHRAAGTDGGFVLDETFVAWNLESDKAINLEFRGFPKGVDRSFHGFDVNQISPDNLTFYLINHRVSGDTVEKFSHTPGTSHIDYIKTITIPPKSEGGAPSANDILAIPELDHQNAFYITNDHAYPEGFMRKLETFLFFKTGYVSYHNDVSGWRIVAENIVTANGITGTKNLPSVQKDPEPKSIDQEEEDEEIFSSTEKSKPEDTSNLVYVSSCDAGIIKLFSRDFSSPEVLKPIQDIILPILSDNPSLSIPSGSSLIVAGHPEPLKVHPHAESSIDSTTRPPSPGGVVRVSTGQLGSKFYGGGGYTTQPDMEEIFLDPKGRLSNATTSAVLIEHGEGQKGDLYITGLTMEGILQCKDFY